MKQMKLVGVLEKAILGWLPQEPVATDASHPHRRALASRVGRLASFVVFEFFVVFTSLNVTQLVGLADYSGFVAGAAAAVAAAVGSVLYLKPVKQGSLRAQVAGFEIPPIQLTHVIDWLGGLVVEGTAVGADRQEIEDRLAALRNGDTVSYTLVTDKGKTIAGKAAVKRITTRAKPDGRFFFTIAMRRNRE